MKSVILFCSLHFIIVPIIVFFGSKVNSIKISSFLKRGNWNCQFSSFQDDKMKLASQQYSSWSGGLVKASDFRFQQGKCYKGEIQENKFHNCCMVYLLTLYKPVHKITKKTWFAWDFNWLKVVWTLMHISESWLSVNEGRNCIIFL